MAGQDTAGWLTAYITGRPPTGSNNAALGAIDQLTGSGNSRFPRPLPMAFGPRGAMPPAGIPLTGVAPPRNRPAPPQVPGAITFKRGDTVSKLAKQRGMTTASFADLFGIKNPNKIYAGQTVFRQAPPVPMRRPMAISRGPAPPVPRMEPAAYNRARQIAEGKASQLDEFGMIR
jgi:LysM repeat protein